MTGKSILWRAYLSAFCVLALTVTSCSLLISEENKNPEVFQVSASATTASALQSSVTVKVTCDLDWSVKLSDESWGTITDIVKEKGQGGSFVFSFEWNTADEARENTLLIRAGKVELSQPIKQEGIANFFKPGAITLTGMQQEKLAFKAPCNWTASITEGSDWLKIGSTGGSQGEVSLIVSAKDANENVGAREGSIKIDFGKASFQIPVSQGQTDVIVLTTGSAEIQVPWDGGSFNVYTGTNVDYKIEPQVSWIHHSETKALNQATEVFTVDINEDVKASRTGVILFKGGDAELSLTVIQERKNPLLEFTSPGVYGILNGENYIYGADGWNQKAVRLNGNSVNFLFINRKTSSLVSLRTSGLDYSTEGNTLTLNPSAGSPIDVNVAIYKGGSKVYSGIIPFEFLYKDSSHVWFATEDNSCLIVNLEEAL